MLARYTSDYEVIFFFSTDSPPHQNEMVDSIKAEYIEDVKMDPDFYRVNEPQVDIIQISDVQTQTDPIPDPNRKIFQKLQALENSINVLRDEWRRDREAQNALMEKKLRRILENQKSLMENFFEKTKNKD